MKISPLMLTNLLLASALFLAACERLDPPQASVPQQKEFRSFNNMKKFWGHDIVIWDNASPETFFASTPLWQGALQALQGLPLKKKDAGQGLLETAWMYQDSIPRRRMKIIMHVMPQVGSVCHDLTVTVLQQMFQEKKWVNEAPDTNRALELKTQVLQYTQKHPAVLAPPPKEAPPRSMLP